MILDRAACEWFKLAITTEPVTGPTDWEASIDGGETWVSAHDVEDNSGWLVAGPDYDGAASPDFTLTSSVHVKVRLSDNPETVIRTAPNITVRNL